MARIREARAEAGVRRGRPLHVELAARRIEGPGGAAHGAGRVEVRVGAVVVDAPHLAHFGERSHSRGGELDDVAWLGLGVDPVPRVGGRARAEDKIGVRVRGRGGVRIFSNLYTGIFDCQIRELYRI